MKINDTRGARIVAERMKKSTKTKTYADLGKLLDGISGQSISKAISRGQIPEKWFVIMEEQFGVTKEELTKPTKAALLVHNQTFGDAEEYNGLSLQRHQKIGAKLYAISQQLHYLKAELEGVYPQTGHLGRANVGIVRACEVVDQTRDSLEENFYKEHPSKRDPSVYYPGAKMAFDSQNIISVNSNYVSEDYYQIPLYDVQASAGPGAYVDGEQVMDVMALRKNWIQNELHLDPAHLSLIFVQGDSMEPTMHSGDTVLIDQREDQGLTDGVWALRIDGALLVKRIQKFPGGKITIISDNNHRYPPYDIVSDNLPEDLKFIGRVVWVGKRM